MPASTSLVEGAAGQAAGEAAEADRENRRRRRRGGRGGRDRDEASGAEESGTAEGTSPATGLDAPAAEAGAAQLELPLSRIAVAMLEPTKTPDGVH